MYEYVLLSCHIGSWAYIQYICMLKEKKSFDKKVKHKLMNIRFQWREPRKIIDLTIVRDDVNGSQQLSGQKFIV